MKKSLLTLFALIPLVSLAQSFKPDENTKSSYTDQPAYLIDTVVVSTYTKQQLYSNALNYVTTSFKDSRNVIELKDAELGEIAIKGNVSKQYTKEIELKKGKKESYQETATLYFKCKIYVKDNKFKVVLSSLESPASSLIDVRMTLRITDDQTFSNNKYARDMAVELIKDISKQLNKKPENDF